MDKKNGHIILFLSVPLCIFITLISCTGIFSNGFYTGETMNWQQQSIGQDMIDLTIIIPALVITSLSSYKGNRIASALWAGVITYIVYTFVIYCFDVHFNRLFLLYCLTLGLSFYSLAWYIFSQLNHPFIVGIKNTIVGKVTAVFFIAIGIAFYLLWLSDIIPALINNTIPKGLAETGLLTNPVHVLDLSIFLPAVIITGIDVARKKTAGFLFAMIILSFFVLMNITIGWLAYRVNDGAASNMPVVIMMTALAIISIILLILLMRNLKIKTA